MCVAMTSSSTRTHLAHQRALHLLTDVAHELDRPRRDAEAAGALDGEVELAQQRADGAGGFWEQGFAGLAQASWWTSSMRRA